MLAASAYALALAQRPGLAVADTKIDLHVDPVGFLGDVASVWSSSGGLGAVQAGQYAGYLFPMGPFFALGDVLGLAPWLVQRLWLGTVLALAAWGTVRLLDALLEQRHGLPHAVAGALVLLNPYVLVFADRTSVTLLGYAALPWLLLAVHRGLSRPAGWWWPAAFALVLAATGGGVNAAVTGWVLLGPVLLVAYELLLGTVSAREVLRFGVRAGALSILASLWWIVPVVAHARYGLNFLPYTESAGAIWATSSVTESLRLMGYWISYLGVGFGDRLVPYFGASGAMLFSPPVVVASLVVPAAALGGFVWSRRWRYGPFMLAMVLAGVMVMMAGFPEGTPLRRALTFVYDRAEAVQFLRTTYKAGPLVALGLACLGGVAAGAASRRLAGRSVLRPAAGAAVALVVAVSVWPLVTGRGVGEEVSFEEVPRAWQDAAEDLDRDLPRSSRALVLPGQLFPFYRWGGTQDPILPALSERPVAVRSLVPYADLHAADLLYEVDSLAQQRRLVPGQLRPLLSLTAVRSVVTGTDDDPLRSGSIPPGEAEALLRRELGDPARAYGSSEPLPQVRRHDLPSADGLVRVHPTAPATVVDGSAEALSGLAAFGALPGNGAALYAGDLTASELRAAVRPGGEVVVSDSNRRRVFLSSRVRQSVGATLGAGDELSTDSTVLNPFPGRGTDGQTVAVLDGVRAIESPFSPNFPQFPEHRPYAALDGDPATAWLGDRYLRRARRWLELRFARPRDVPHVELLPALDSRTEVTAVEVAGKRFSVRPGWNRLPTGLRGVSRLRVRIAGTRAPPGGLRGPGGLAELRIPGLRVAERLRPPVLAERALRGADLERTALTYLFERTTGDDPFRRGPRPDPARGYVPRGRNLEAALVAEPEDAERQIARRIDLPARREFRAEAWVSAGPEMSDPALDALAGRRGEPRLSSSGRYRGLPAHRASSAFDGERSTAWVAPADAAEPAWIGWRSPGTAPLRRLRIVAPRGARAPLSVRLRSETGATGEIEVSPTGEIALRRPLPGRSFRLEVLRVPPGERAVGVAELRGTGLGTVPVRRRGALTGGCKALTVSTGDGELPMRVGGRVEDLDAGRPLRARNCGAPLALGPGRATVSTRSRGFRPYLLRLRSPAPAGPAPVLGGGRVVEPGRESPGSYDDVRLATSGPSWLVLGESYNRGWRARCGTRDLGPPRPVDGFANGWRIAGSCREASFAFAPNTWARWSYAISGLGVLVMVVGLLLFRRRRATPGGPLGDLVPGGRSTGLPLRRALAIGVAVALAGGFLFALRAGVVIGPLVALLLWRGVSVRALVLGGSALLGVAVPLLYLVLLPDDLGGFNSEYSTELIAAHWVGLAGFVALGVALIGTLSRARGRAGGREPARADAAEARGRP